LACNNGKTPAVHLRSSLKPRDCCNKIYTPQQFFIIFVDRIFTTLFERLFTNVFDVIA